MRDEALETLFVMTGKIVNAETAEAGTDSAKTVFIYVRQVLASVVNS